MEFAIATIDRRLEATLQSRLEAQSELPGTLGLLERLALRVGLIRNNPAPDLARPTLMVCAGDHGAILEGISADSSELTRQRMQAMLAGNAPINRLTRANGLELVLVDAGMAREGADEDRGHEHLVDARIDAGTRNYARESAMDRDQCSQALANGVSLVDQLHRNGCNVLGVGELGAGGAASAALLMSLFCNLPLERCVGPDAAMDEAAVYHKIKVLHRARERIRSSQALRDPLTALSEFGGFEIVTLCGAMLGAAERRMVVLVDGYVTTAALLGARAINSRVMDYCIASHRSEEVGHNLMLQQLHARPLLDLRLQQGGGLGAALAWPLVNGAAALLGDDAPAPESEKPED
jgi:nicotinate-nucleotide--dimethylbenzimidazole phosphoribosyltransferase